MGTDILKKASAAFAPILYCITLLKQ